MPTTYNFKNVHDLPEWVGCSNSLNANAAAGCLAWDSREGIDRHPLIYQLVSAAVLNAYNPQTDEWIFVGNPGLGTFAAGAGAIFVASAGPNGTIAAGASTTSIPVTTAFPAAVGVNQLANRGDGVQGFKVRIVGLTAGKTEERYIVGNTGGTTPTLTLDSALSFAPTNSDKYYLLSGRVFLMATAATILKYYDIATNSFSAALTVTNLTTPAIDNTMTVLDELWTPAGKLPGQGFFGEMTATAATNVTNATLTGTSAAADASLQANEYANFQIRITQDGTNPGSVGQRLKITSHTGANPTVYTLNGVWGTAPSATAKYVVEGVGDIICMTGSAVALAHTYAAAGWRADGAWSTGVTNGAVAALQIPARQANTAAGQVLQWAYGFSSLDAAKATRYSGVYFFRGGGVNTIDCLDLATLSWTTGIGGADIAYGNKGSTTFTTGTCGVYDPNTNGGKYLYLNQSGTQRFLRFDMKNRMLEPWNFYRQPQGVATLGARMAGAWAVDGSAYGFYPYFWGATQSNFTRALAPN